MEHKCIDILDDDKFIECTNEINNSYKLDTDKIINYHNLLRRDMLESILDNKY